LNKADRKFSEEATQRRLQKVYDMLGMGMEQKAIAKAVRVSLRQVQYDIPSKLKDELLKDGKILFQVSLVP
jgi:hypothetical protein